MRHSDLLDCSRKHVSVFDKSERRDFRRQYNKLREDCKNYIFLLQNSLFLHYFMETYVWENFTA